MGILGFVINNVMIQYNHQGHFFGTFITAMIKTGIKDLYAW